MRFCSVRSGEFITITAIHKTNKDQGRKETQVDLSRTYKAKYLDLELDELAVRMAINHGAHDLTRAESYGRSSASNKAIAADSMREAAGCCSWALSC